MTAARLARPVGMGFGEDGAGVGARVGIGAGGALCGLKMARSQSMNVIRSPLSVCHATHRKNAIHHLALKAHWALHTLRHL